MTISHDEVRKAIVKVAETFQGAVINDLRVNYHPDNDFEEYIHGDSEEPSFDSADRFRLNAINEALLIALDDGQEPDMYDVGLPILNKAIDKAIALDKLKPRGLLGE